MNRLTLLSIIKRMLIVVVFVGLLFLAGLVFGKAQSSSFFGAQILEENRLNEMIAGLNEIENSQSQENSNRFTLRIGNNAIPYDWKLERYYLPWNSSKSMLWDKLTVSDADCEDTVVYIQQDEYTNRIDDSVRDDHEFTIYLIGNKTFQKSKLVISYLPMLDVTRDGCVTEWYEGKTNKNTSFTKWNDNNTTMTADCDKSVSVFGMNKSRKWKLSEVREDDYSYIRTLLAKYTWNKINSNLNLYMEGEIAELVYDGEYKGLYYVYPDTKKGEEIIGGLLNHDDITYSDALNILDYLTFVQYTCAYDNIDDDMLITKDRQIFPKKFDYTFGIQPGRYGYLSYNSQSRIITLSECGIRDEEGSLDKSSTDIFEKVADRWKSVRSDELSEKSVLELIDMYSEKIIASGYQVRHRRYSEYHRLLTDHDAKPEDNEIDVFSDEYAQFASDEYVDNLQMLKRYVSQRMPYVDAYYAGLIDENGKNTDGIEYILYNADAEMPDVAENNDYKGYVNIWCGFDQNQQSHNIKLYAKEGKLIGFMPSYAAGEYTLEYDRSKYGVWVDGKLAENGALLSDNQIITIVGDEFAEEGSEGVYQLCFMKSDNIGATFIDTANATMDYVDFSKLRKEPGKAYFYLKDGKLSAEGDFDAIKVRGHSSSVQAKKAYRLKMSNETDVYGMGSAKDWLLIANAVDASKLRNYVAYTMAKEWGIPYISDFEWADVYLNGEYNGNYMIMEPIEAGENRVEIDTSGEGIILEMKNRDYRLHEEDIWFTDASGMIITVKSPKEVSEDKLKNTEDFIKDVTEQMESCRTEKQYLALAEKIDMESFALMYLMDEITNEIDAGWFSTYYFINPKDGKLYAGPVWDYDKCLGNQKDRGIYPQFDCFYYCYPELLSDNEYFMQEVKGLYESTVRPSVVRMIEEGLKTEQEYIRLSEYMDEIVRPVKSGSVINAGSFDDNVAYISDYLNKRLELVDEIIYNSSDYHKVFIESRRGRLCWVKDKETISQELIDYICKIYSCEYLATETGKEFREGDIVEQEMILYPEGVVAK